MITILQYGLGNIKAIQNVYEKLNIPVKFASTESDLENVKKIILPGVGSFDYAMEKFNGSGMREKVNQLVLEDSVPILGICVGMQMLAQSSEEGKLPGLAWIDGTVKKFQRDISDKKIILPHMGWNDVIPKKISPLFQELESEAKFYFLHSYYMSCSDENLVLANAHYPQQFVCAVERKNIFGVQFHPEKSHKYGMKLLENFSKL